MNDHSKKKIGTLTFHIAHNYGAMLQAYALPTAVQKLGYDCEVIDYRFRYIDQWSRIEFWTDLYARYGLVSGSLRFLKRAVTGYYLPSNMHIRFDAFERKIIPHSTKVYREKSELNCMPYDAILFGSDQIWNSALTNGLAEEYIGGFACLPGTRKIAYAASCGTSDFQPESRAVYEEHLRDFYAISVREREFQETLCTRNIPAEWVLDPTLLLTAEEWLQITPDGIPITQNKYLLIYAFDVADTIYDLARNYAKEQGLEIIAIAYKKTPAMHGMKVLTNCGPLEFLSLFTHAEHIIAASFHGTVFSILFHKPFHCVPHPKFRERTDSLLQMLNLTDHIVEELTELRDVETDWEKVDHMLDERRECSLSFLKKMLASD